MRTICKVEEVRRRVSQWQRAGERVALVPTMGNLHQGHMSLVDLARGQADRVVVSLFVNPSQFGPKEDFTAYPRTLDEDRERLRGATTDLLFVPDEQEMYPFGVESMTKVSVPGLSEILCGASRPGHFDGVTAVVCRLINIVQPQLAVFGQKDYQQLKIIQRMIADLHLATDIVSGPTQREDDGLAMSSRNQYLNETQRASAAQIYASLKACAARIVAGEREYSILEEAGCAQLRAADLTPDYFAVRVADDLSLPGPNTGDFVILAAAQCGPARLIDNLTIVNLG